jgi:uncharacterized protein (TIGR02145 family)
MKNAFTILAVVLLTVGLALPQLADAQSPQLFNYQAIARDNQGDPITNQDVSFQISILQGNASGIVVYAETHTTTTNEFGLVNLEVGNGTVVSGDFTTINWGDGSYFLETEMDETGGTNYQLMGTSQLLSVPYSLHSSSLTLTSPGGISYEVTVDDNGNLSTHCFPMPTVADAGPDQAGGCTPTWLEANTPIHGTGAWTLESGANGVIEEPNNPLSEFTGDYGSSYTLRWTITTVCDTSYDEVNIDFMPPPTVADAGPDQINVTPPTTLNGNTPVVGSGQWTIISGTGGTISEPANPTSLFTGILDSTYTLRWTISTICMSSYDEVNISFSEECPATVTDIDGNVYNTVLIGEQCWMKENLKTTTYKNGTAIPNVTDINAWSNLTTGAYVWYDNDISWKEKYGALYNWFTAVDPNGLCPTGWHVPTHNEWTDLTDYIGGVSAPHGNELKSCRQVNSPLGGGCNTSEHPRWDSDNSNWGTDDYGLSCLPGGLRIYDGTFNYIGEYGEWWSTTVYGAPTAWLRALNNTAGNIYVYINQRRTGMSVRCLRDN